MSVENTDTHLINRGCGKENEKHYWNVSKFEGAAEIIRYIENILNNKIY